MEYGMAQEDRHDGILANEWFITSRDRDGIISNYSIFNSFCLIDNDGGGGGFGVGGFGGGGGGGGDDGSEVCLVWILHGKTQP